MIPQGFFVHRIVLPDRSYFPASVYTKGSAVNPQKSPPGEILKKVHKNSQIVHIKKCKRW
jgi:hypothetical protein